MFFILFDVMKYLGNYLVKDVCANIMIKVIHEVATIFEFGLAFLSDFIKTIKKTNYKRRLASLKQLS